MKRVFFWVFCGFLVACSKSDTGFFDDKKELMLRSVYHEKILLSYLGEQNDQDYVLIASKDELKDVYFDENQAEFEKINKDDFDLPYKNDFFYFYKASAKASKNFTINIKINLKNDKKTNITVQKISKSLM